MRNKHIRRMAICLLVISLTLLITSNGYSFPNKGIEIDIKGTITEMYNDNIRFSTEDIKRDFITKLRFALGVKYTGKTQVLAFESNISRSMYAEYHYNNNTSGMVTLNFHNEFSKYDRISLSDNFTHTFEPAGFEDEFGRTRAQSKSSHNTFKFVYRRDISEQLIVNSIYSNELNKVSGEQTGKSYRNSLGLATNYIYSAATSFFLLYDFTKREFQGGGDFSAHTVSTGMRMYITKQLYFDGIIGADFIKSTLGDTYTAGIGAYIKALVTDEFKNTNVRVSFEKRKQPNVFREELFDSWRTSVSLTRQLLKRLSCSISGFYGQGTYESSDITGELLGADIGFTYEFSENLKGNLNYAHSEKTSTDITTVYEYSRNTILSSLSVEF